MGFQLGRVRRGKFQPQAHGMLYEPAFLSSTEFNVKGQRSPLLLMLQPEARLIPHRQPCRVTRASGEVAFGFINGYDPQDVCDFYPTPIGPGGVGMERLAARRSHCKREGDGFQSTCKALLSC